MAWEDLLPRLSRTNRLLAYGHEHAPGHVFFGADCSPPPSDRSRQDRVACMRRCFVSYGRSASLTAASAAGLANWKSGLGRPRPGCATTPRPRCCESPEGWFPSHVMRGAWTSSDAAPRFIFFLGRFLAGQTSWGPDSKTRRRIMLRGRWCRGRGRRRSAKAPPQLLLGSFRPYGAT